MSLRRLLFTAAIGFNALLLFLVQPLVARLLLPIFGGSPAVWNVSLLFFQSALILGYLTADRGPARLGRRRHGLLHLGALALGLASALLLRDPILALLRRTAPGTGAPIPLLLLGLTLLVGLPYWALSAGSPLLQRWFAATDDPRAADPYFLYAASNVGSLGALFLYPLVLEPRWDLLTQWRIWLGGIVIAAALIALCLRITPAGERAAEAEAPRVEPRTRLTWLALAAVPSVLSMGATTALTTNVAPVPLIWVLPLAVYLLSFILAFASRPLADSKTLGRAFALLATPLLLVLALEASHPAFLLGGFHLVVLLVGCWALHARLAESRPPAAGLTGFYLTMSVGGALGGVFAAILAPLLFTGYAEYPLAICAALALRPALVPDDRPKPALLYAAGVVALVGALALAAHLLRWQPSPWRTGIAIGGPLLLAFAAYDRPLRMALMAGAAFFGIGLVGLASQGRVVLARRSFFGVHRVVQDGPVRSLVHGTTYHGRQNARFPDRPLTYYHPTGPVGLLMRSEFGRSARTVGVVGLGVGSLAAYGQKGQSFTLFEIDPAVIAIARDPSLFTFLRDSKANLRFVPGDARLTLAKVPDASFDLLVLDAFSSDAIPTHLLTAEAVALYARKLRPGGAIAFHISNRYLELAPTLAATAARSELLTFDATDGASPDEEKEGKTQSHWALLTRDPDLPARLGRGTSWDRTDPAGARAWTDDHSDPLSVLKDEESP